MSHQEDKTIFEIVADFKQAFWVVMQGLGVVRLSGWIIERIERLIK